MTFINDPGQEIGDEDDGRDTPFCYQNTVASLRKNNRKKEEDCKVK